MKIGVLLCVYQDHEFINSCLQPWVEAKKEYDIDIAITHGMFKEYKELGFEDNDNETIEKLIKYYQNKALDFLYIQNHNETFNTQLIYQNEAELRNHGLKWLLEKNPDFFWTLGADEIYKPQEIHNIIQKIQDENFCDWFRIHHKNYVFDNHHYIKGFCPPRIWNNKRHGGIDKFYWDDDIVYKDGTNYQNLPCYVIPERLAFIDHYTWLSNEKSKNKVRYHEKHFSHGAGCSYKWNDSENKLEFNLDYYKKTGQPMPEVIEI